jgi:hypothetical protein
MESERGVGSFVFLCNFRAWAISAVLLQAKASCICLITGCFGSFALDVSLPRFVEKQRRTNSGFVL